MSRTHTLGSIMLDNQSSIKSLMEKLDALEKELSALKKKVTKLEKTSKG